MATIRGITEEQTQRFLKKASTLIKLDEKAGPDDKRVKFRKEHCAKGPRDEGLAFSIVKANDGTYYALGDRKIETHKLGRGSYSEVRVAYPLIWDNDQLILGQEIVVKEAVKRKNEDSFEENNQNRYQSIISYEDNKATEQTRINRKGKKKFYIFTQLIEGDALSKFLRQDHFRNMPISKILDFVLSLMPSLINLHYTNGEVHRDIKPDNIIYSSRTNTGQITDYEFRSPIGATTSKMTAMYASPEMAKDDIALTANDIYAFGLVLTELFQRTQESKTYPHTKEGKESYQRACSVFANKFKQYDAAARVGRRERVFMNADAVIDIFPGLFECPEDPTDNFNFYQNLVAFLKKMTDRDPQNRPTAIEVQEFFDEFRAKYELVMRQKILLNLHFNHHVTNFETITTNLKTRGHQGAVDAAQLFYDNLITNGKAFLEGKGPLDEAKTLLKTSCLQAIDEANKTLKNHRKWRGTIASFMATCLNYLSRGLLAKWGFFPVLTASSEKLSSFKDDLNVQISDGPSQ